MSTVDILVPAYNSAQFLPGALESVLAQTVPDWRILLVDDGSTDNTREVVEEFVRTHPELDGRLTYIYQANRGLPGARNAGIQNSSSPLIALLDADDLWLPDRLADSISSFEGRPNVGLSYGGISRFADSPANILDTFTTSDLGKPGEAATRIYTSAVHLPCPTVTFRRECLKEVGMFDESMRATEDRDLWLRLAQRYGVVFVPKVLALYRASPNSMSGDLPRMLTAQRQFIEKHFGEPGCDAVARRAALARVLEQQTRGYSARHQHGKALFFAAQAIAHAPTNPGVLRTGVSTLAAAIRRKQ